MAAFRGIPSILASPFPGPRVGILDGRGFNYDKYWSIGGDKAIFMGANFLPGLYQSGHINLGSAVEFRSQFEFGLVQVGQWRVSAYIEHRSNAGIGRINPGIEEFGVNFGFGL